MEMDGINASNAAVSSSTAGSSISTAAAECEVDTTAWDSAAGSKSTTAAECEVDTELVGGGSFPEPHKFSATSAVNCPTASTTQAEKGRCVELVSSRTSGDTETRAHGLPGGEEATSNFGRQVPLRHLAE